jgi:hypothetical protein
LYAGLTVPKIAATISSTSSNAAEVHAHILTLGKKIYPNGYMYEGEWLEGVREGLGTLFNPLGLIIYQGEWR